MRYSRFGSIPFDGEPMCGWAVGEEKLKKMIIYDYFFDGREKKQAA